MRNLSTLFSFIFFTIVCSTRTSQKSVCQQDAYLKQLSSIGSSAKTFCQKYVKTAMPLPPYLQKVNPSIVSSACSCLIKPTSTTTTSPTTTTGIMPAVTNYDCNNPGGYCGPNPADQTCSCIADKAGGGKCIPSTSECDQNCDTDSECGSGYVCLDRQASCNALFGKGNCTPLVPQCGIVAPAR